MAYLRSLQRIHWRAPTTIISAFLFGLLFAIGHHLFYNSLNGKTVDDEIFSQQFNSAVGTAFAFLVRAALVISIGTSYWQVFWGTLSRRQLRVDTVDSMAGLLSSLLEFLNLRAIVASPWLTSLAAVSWLIPLAAIVPPATLSVQSAHVISYTQQHLPAPNFLGNSMARTYLQQSDGGGGPNSPPEGAKIWNVYHGPTNYLTRVAMGTALEGQLPVFPAPAVNASFERKFSAPSVRCAAADRSVLMGFTGAMGCDPTYQCGNLSVLSGSGPSNGTARWVAFSYLSWTPNQNLLIPFGNGSISENASLPISDGNPASFLGSQNSMPATLFVASKANVKTGEWSVLNCSLYNASYTANFTFQENFQSATLLSVNETEAIPAVFAGSSRSGFPTHTPEPTSEVEQFNYQALMEVLGRILVGTISSGSSVIGDDRSAGTMGVADGDIVSDHTQIMQTELAFTEELYPIYNGSCNTQFTGYCTDSGTISGSTEGNVTSRWFGRPLSNAIEELFQNMTLSLFSKSVFLNESNFATNITITEFRNVYHYDHERLWLSYGLAIGSALLAVLMGLGAILRNKASYSEKFTTVMRTTSGEYTSVPIMACDRGGVDPLPEYIAKAQLQLSSQSSSSHTYMEVENPAVERKHTTLEDSNEDEHENGHENEQ
jgi:hypothetical protein